MEVASPISPASMELSPQRLMQFNFGFAPPLIIEVAIRHKVFATHSRSMGQERRFRDVGCKSVLHLIADKTGAR